MIHEIATLTVNPNQAASFEAAVAKARPLFLESPNCLSFSLDRVIEEPGTYCLVVGWTSVQAHIETFRESENFQKWRELVSPFFAKQPVVIHTERVTKWA